MLKTKRFIRTITAKSGFGLLCILMFCLLLPGSAVSNSDWKYVNYTVGQFDVRYISFMLSNPELIQAVEVAVNNYDTVPDVNNCVELATWFRDGLETVLKGNLIELVANDPSVYTGRQVLPSITGILRQVMQQVLEADPSLCTKESYDDNLAVIPETGPLALKAKALLNKRGGHMGFSPAGQLGVVVDIVEGIPLVFELDLGDHELEIESESHADWYD